MNRSERAQAQKGEAMMVTAANMSQKVKTEKGASSMKLKRSLLGGVVYFASLFFLQNAFAADVILKDISFASLPGGRFEVKMDFDGTPPEPAGYEIDKPARIVLDFAGVESALEAKKFPLPFDNAKSAIVLGSGDRTRLILNMAKLDLYDTRIEGASFFIEVGNNKVEDFMVSSTTIADKVTSEINDLDVAITNIDFRRGENGEGKIIIDLSDPAVNINVDQASDEIKLSFLDTQLPVNLRRRLDVTDFATPVLFVSSDFNGRDTVVTIKPQGDYDYLAYQTGQEYVVSVKELTAQELEERKTRFTFVGEKLSLNFQDIPVRSVLQIIADFTELNLVASDTVDGTITLRLDNVPWDQALALVLKTKGLDKRQIGNVLMVAPASEIAEQERQQLETNRQLEELAPLVTEFIQVLYADAAEIFELFDTGGSDGAGTESILSERGRAIVDARTNSIILTETQNKINEFRKLIEKIDIPVRQVSIEARIVRAETSFAKELGVRWGYDTIGDVGGTSVVSSGGLGAAIDKANGDSVTYGGFNQNSALVSDLGVLNSAARWSMGILSGGNHLALELSAMQSTGQGELVSQPTVVTQDKQEAIIKNGEEIPYQETSSSGATTVSFREALLKLQVTPYITPNDKILLDLLVVKASRGETELNDIPTINKTELQTKVLVNNGETIVLGGVFEEANRELNEKVPFFGDLPFLGKLFRRTATTTDKVEILVFLTPKILNDPLAGN